MFNLTPNYMKNTSTTWEDRFYEKFGKHGQYLCQYNPGMETHTSNHEDVKDFIRETLLAELQQAQREERERMVGILKDAGYVFVKKPIPEIVLNYLLKEIG